MTTYTVLSGTTSNGLIVTGGDTLTVYNGGTVTSTQIDGGSATISGVGIGTTVSGPSTVLVESGTLYSTGIASSGAVIIDSGTALGTTVSSGGSLYVRYGGSASGTIVESGGLEKLYNQTDTIADTVVDSGGRIVGLGLTDGSLDISSGFTLDGATVLSGATVGLRVWSGVTVSGFNLVGNTNDLLVEGGTANATTVGSGTQLLLETGATNGSLVTGGGYYEVDGGASSGTVISSGGYEVLWGGTETGATLASGGQLDVSGGVLTSAVLSGGVETVYSGGLSQHTTILFGGGESIQSGGVAIGAQVSGSQLLSGGTAYDSTIDSGGFQIVYAGGTALGTSVGSGGNLQIFGGGSASGTIVESGGQEKLFASTSTIADTVVNSGGRIVGLGLTDGSLDISSGFTLDGATVMSGATVGLRVWSGVTVSGFNLVGNTNDIVVEGGTANATAVGSGTELLLDTGAANGSLVAGGGYLEVDGGTASGTVISAGGLETVYAGGLTSGSQVTSGGTEQIGAEGAATNLALANGGTADLTYLAYASGATATLNAGTDVLTVSAGGTDTTLQLSGTYSGTQFQLADDGNGGTDVLAAPAAPEAALARWLTRAPEASLAPLPASAMASSAFDKLAPNPEPSGLAQMMRHFTVSQS